MKFESLSLSESLLRGLEASGYETATPIQEQAIPQVLQGRDLVACRQTGTGKTAAFALPTLQRLMDTAAPVANASTNTNGRRNGTPRRPIRSLILAPTRELAGQIGSSLAKYGRFSGLRQTVIYGGVRQGPQVKALQAGVDLLVATPGRLLDLIGQGFVDLASVEILILDEADQMLDMGFLPDLRRIVDLVPDQRQTLMFSATMPPAVRKLASQWLRQPHELQVAAAASTPSRVSQAVFFVERHHKAATLARFLLKTERAKTLVFSRTKRGADKIAKVLERDGIRAVAIHGDKSQSRRQAVMREFNSQRPPVLVATDLAARGLDFTDVSHVINYDMPDAPETYIHRIGRTARAGNSGHAVTFCGHDERQRLRMIEKLTGQVVTVETVHGERPVGPASGNHAPPSPTTPNDSTTALADSNGGPPSKPRPKHRARRGGRPPHGGAPGGPGGSKRRKFSKPGGGQKKRRPPATSSGN